VIEEPTVAAPLRVVIADDHPYYRMGLSRSLQARGIDVVAEAPNGEAAIRAVHDTMPDVVVMDLRMPGVSGLEAMRRLRERAPRSRVLALSVSTDEQDVTEAILAGASGYVLKESPVEEVVAAIRATASGESHISPQIAMLLLRRVRGASAETGHGRVRLSPRELDVLDLLAHGKADHEIAEMLGITPPTVRGHASSILTKLVQSALQESRGQAL
jgi:DNA-binding NarL/FixJ family response regulator